MGLSRRGWIAGVLGGGGAIGAGFWLADRQLADRQPATTTVAEDDLDALIDRFLLSEPEDCLRVVAEPTSRGVPRDRILAALMLAPALSGGDAGDVHAMAVMPAVRRMCQEATTPTERWVPLLWSAANSHAWSRRDRTTFSTAQVSDPPTALTRAMREGDDEAAEGAAGAMADQAGVIETADLLALESTRPRQDPHVTIWASASRRLLAHCEPHHTALVQAVARYAAFRGAPHAEPRPLHPNDHEPTTAETIVAAVHDSHDTPLDGLGSSALWETLALLTIETRLSDLSATGLGVHQTTLLDALFRIWAEADEASRDEVLSRAVAWIVQLHRDNAGSADVFALTETGGDPLALAQEDPIAGYRAALGAVARDESDFLERVRARVAFHVDNSHDLKHWCAVLDVAERLTDTTRKRWLATLSLAWTVRRNSRWPRREEAEALAASV